MLKFAVTNTIDNQSNLNIAMLDKSVDIRQDTVLQINDLSTSYQDNLTPLYTDTITVKSDSDGKIDNIGNKFKSGVKITDRYIFNPETKLTVPLWYQYQPPVAMITKSASPAINRFNVVETNIAYKLSYAEDSYVVKNNYSVYRRRYSWENWLVLSSADYTINKAEDTFTLTNPLFAGFNIKVVNTTVSDPIRLYYDDDSPVEDVDIELIEIVNAPVNGFAESDSLETTFYIKTLLHEKPEKTLHISFQGYSDYKDFIVNPDDIYREDKEFSVGDNYVIQTDNADTLFYVKLPNRNSILSIVRSSVPQEANWNIMVPSESVDIDSYTYFPKEDNVMNYRSVITVEESINQVDDERIKLTYDNIYLIRGSDNKPLNISMYSLLEDGEIINHDDIIEDVDVFNKLLIVSNITPINKIRTVVRYQIKLDHSLIYSYDTNSHKMFNKDAALSNIIVYMLPQDEVVGNETVFFFPVYNYYEYMDPINENHRSLTGAITYITNGGVKEEISEYVATDTINPIILGIISYINPVAANDVSFLDVRRLGADIAYDYVINPYEDSDHHHYTTVGWWWGRPMNLDNIAIVYIKQATIDRLETLYSTYDLNTSRKLNNSSFNLEKFILDEIVRPKIKDRLRVGAKLLLEVVNE